MNIFISDRGAVPDKTTLNTKIIQKAIDDCAQSGGGKVIISGGSYLTGSIVLKSNVNLHLEADGVLLGSPNCEDYPEKENLKHVDTSLLPRWRNACLIYAEECENISITGNGTIDCNGHSFVRRSESSSRRWDYERIDAPTPPRVVFFAGCKNIKIEDVTMVNQPAGWSYWISDCDYVTFDKIKIIANVNYPNNDGIHINCSRNVSVSNCHITCGDDCLVVRANSVALKENKICEKVVVTNCNLTSYSGGIRIGWLNDGVIKNCTFSNIVMTDTSVGISIILPYIMPDKNNMASADIGREATHIENLLFNNIMMDKTASNPLKIMIYDNPFVKCAAIKNIYFSNLHTSGPELPMIIGRKNCKIKNIYFNDCSFEMTDGTEFENLATHGACTHTDNGFYPMNMRYVENVSFQNTQFHINR